ncbi:MAG TPA: HAMP domain-containing sensor histidine kinase [Vicinamibacterales bacterium]|nr:HAMP domain-containing sensor histidine kinase [Vicinamibacterales bacterium]
MVFRDRKTPPWQLLVPPIVLLTLLVALGTLQYRWLGEVSEAERARMRDGLRTRTAEFSRDFDRELTRTYSAFHLTTEQIDTGEAAALDAAWTRWRTAAAAPMLVRDVYMAVGNTFDSAQLRRLDPARHALDAVAWPPALADSLVRTHFSLPRILGTSPAPPPIMLADTIDSRIPALIIPVTRINRATTATGQITVVTDPAAPGRVVIVVLDAGQMQHQLIEPLVARHFGEGAASEYLVTIARRDEAGSVVYNSSATMVDASTADVTTGMFGLRDDDSSTASDRLAAGLPPPGAARLAVTIVRKATGSGDSHRLLTSGPDEQGAWIVRTRHRAGSLDAIVAQSRRRNLVIGLGVLGLLAASFVLVVVSAQRQQRLARQQMEFVAAVSHELRTPLAVICSAAENLADGVVADGPQVKRYGSLIQTEGRRLGDMVERVLHFAGISSGTTVRADAAVDVTAVIGEAVHAISADARDRGVSVAVDTPATQSPVVGDATALRSAIQNVVGNAVKYSARGGEVTVSAGLVHDDRIIRIRVVDLGIGIDPVDLAHVFEPFFRGRRAVESQVRGTGVGLSVVQQVIRSHGGDVHVDSRAGEGTAVTIVLPAARASETSGGRPVLARLRRGTASAMS